MISHAVGRSRTPELCNVCIIAKCKDTRVWIIFWQRIIGPVSLRLLILVKPSTVCIACQAVYKNDIHDSRIVIFRFMKLRQTNVGAFADRRSNTALAEEHTGSGESSDASERLGEDAISATAFADAGENDLSSRVAMFLRRGTTSTSVRALGDGRNSGSSSSVRFRRPSSWASRSNGMFSRSGK
jgi:hypothetical protein